MQEEVNVALAQLSSYATPTIGFHGAAVLRCRGTEKSSDLLRWSSLAAVAVLRECIKHAVRGGDKPKEDAALVGDTPSC